jgi:hypothetical protein
MRPGVRPLRPCAKTAGSPPAPALPPRPPPCPLPSPPRRIPPRALRRPRSMFHRHRSWQFLQDPLFLWELKELAPMMVPIGMRYLTSLTSPAVHNQHPACRRESLLHRRRQRGGTLPLGRLSAMGPARRSSGRAASWSSPEMPFGSAPTTSSARCALRISAIGHVQLRKCTRRSRSTRTSPRTHTERSFSK